MVLGLCACTGSGTKTNNASGIKAGFIFLHDENSTYDLNFINAAKEACVWPRNYEGACERSLR